MKKDGRQVERLQLPLRVAFHISLQSVRIRFWRSVITAAGTVLGIAFLVSVLTAMMIQRNSGAITDPSERYRMTWLVMMSLLVCLVGITNAMLMSVTERYKEIGTMKCLGAYDIFIVELFFIESALVGFIASVIGWFLGVLSVIVVKLFGEGFKVFGWISSGEVFLYLLMSMVIGTLLSIIATIIPAQVAARMPAAAALRVEV
jgi:predicted lysophospholipase L1 biosynthesis ABC-type transport system permease subunit